MSFPDMDSLKRHAPRHKFRQPNEGESEESYRDALAHHVSKIDYIESCEIRNKVGWDKFTPQQNERMVLDAMMATFLKR